MTQSRQETPPEKQKSTLTQSFITGSVAGSAEVLIDHPLWVIKTRMQRRDPFTLDPRLLYRGIVPNIASMTPITALQVGLNHFFQTTFFRNKASLSDSERLASSFAAGISSSFVSCPTEMVMTYQGHSGHPFTRAARLLAKEAGWRSLFRGLGATAMREGVFTTSFLAGTPILKRKIHPYFNNDHVATLFAGMGSGILATLASQGADTIKTIQQSAPAKQPVALLETIKKHYSTEGLHGFFKGGMPRGARVMSAITIMGAVNEKMEDAFKRFNTEKHSL